MITTILVMAFVVLGLFHLYVHYGRKGKLVNKIPGPKIIPILGNVYQYMLPSDQLWSAQRDLCNDYYPISRIWFGSMCGIGIRHPDDAQILLTSTKNIKKSMIYDFLHPWLGTGLLTSTGEKWRSRRKMLTPAFHYNILQGFVDIFVEEAQKLVQSLKKEGGVIVKDIEPLLTKFTLNSICETAMGTSVEKMEGESQYRSAVREMGDFVFFRLLRPWFHFNWLFNLSPSGFKQQKIIKILHGFSTKIIRDRKKYHEETFLMQAKKTEDDAMFGGCKKKLSMLDVLIFASRNNIDIDDESIREEVDTFVFEGHDTTAMGLIFALALLAEHKEIQELARNEICQVLEKSEGKMGMSEINDLIYLERCIKESLRLYPSVPTITRVIQEDLQMKDYLVPAGANVHLYIYDLHRDPNFWPNPEKFNPDRFLPEEIRKRHTFSYVPFSGGQRNCIGQKFAMLELKTLIAHVLYHFELEAVDLAHEVVVIQDLVIRPKHPVRVKFKSIPRFAAHVRME